MNKTKFYAYAGAIALLSIGFTACSSEDEVAEVNPTFDPVAGTVTTNFVLNVSSAQNTQTRMTAATVQKNENFRGMQDARLFVLKTGKAESFLAPYLGGTITPLKTFDLGNLYTTSQVSNAGTNNAENSSHRILELAMPLTSDAMLVYGRAIKASADADDAVGAIITNYGTVADPSKITFDLKSRLLKSEIIADPTTNANYTVYNNTRKLAALIFNVIMKAETKERTDFASNPYEHNGVAATGNLPALKWRELGATYKAIQAETAAAGTSLSTLEEIMGEAFAAITKINDGEYRSGSASAMATQIYYINKMATSVLSATALDQRDLNAQRLAEELAARINNYFTGLTAATTATFKDLGDASTTGTIIQSLVNAHIAEAADFNDGGTYAGVTDNHLKKFPTSFNLPMGAAVLAYEDYDADGTKGFSYIIPSTSLIDASATIHSYKYMYPAELYYFDNSLLRVSDVEKTEPQYPNGYNQWDNPSGNPNWADFTIGAVKSSTRSVAVKNNINYGVAMLQTKVALTDGAAYVDNKHKFITTEENQTITEANIKKMQLTGILIGDQHNQMNWQYLPNNTAATGFEYIVYDNVIPNDGVIPTATGQEVYTLLFDNYKTGDQSKVKIALEFKNASDVDFYGKDNLIRAGGTFYLVGELDPTKGGTMTWDTYYPVPPYTAAGLSTKTPRIFTQDYMTSVTFKFNATTLQNAYVTVPDLRSTQTSLGLSVDLKWQQGMQFSDIVL